VYGQSLFITVTSNIEPSFTITDLHARGQAVLHAPHTSYARWRSFKGTWVHARSFTQSTFTITQFHARTSTRTYSHKNALSQASHLHFFLTLNFTQWLEDIRTKKNTNVGNPLCTDYSQHVNHMKGCTHFSLFPNTSGNISACVSKVSLLSNSLYDSEGFKVTVCYQKSTSTYINVSYHYISHLHWDSLSFQSLAKLHKVANQSSKQGQLAKKQSFFKNRYKYM